MFKIRRRKGGRGTASQTQKDRQTDRQTQKDRHRETSVLSRKPSTAFVFQKISVTDPAESSTYLTILTVCEQESTVKPYAATLSFSLTPSDAEGRIIIRDNVLRRARRSTLIHAAIPAASTTWRWCQLSRASRRETRLFLTGNFTRHNLPTSSSPSADATAVLACISS